ncbi:SMP-30/gluconolactonase/LRE family protein [Cryptosporangium minutisporangium]|uniref:SMP-30/gluconolactonase/LRE family protein n=1 Tax=Cryptosporangium minutisporangium TaxID=113569 RepID=A0ABP6SRZ1_9ACTN
MVDAVSEAVRNARSIPARELARGFSWPECPRWHDGAFYFSDMYNHTVLAVAEDGSTSVFIDARERDAATDVEVVLGGFGWLPDGRVLVTSMHEKLVLVWDGTALETWADLSDLAPGPINDMVVDADGRAYVTQLGFDLFNGAEVAASDLLVVEPDRSVRALSDVGSFLGANGIAITADGTRLITVEAFASRVEVLDRAADGTLSNRRTFAAAPFLPDGICLDDEGGVWAAMPGSGYVVRIVEGGTVTDAVAIPLESGFGSACGLGGTDRRTLYVTVGLEVMDFAKSRAEGLASIWVADVAVSGGKNRP